MQYSFVEVLACTMGTMINTFCATQCHDSFTSHHKIYSKA